jgi:hypothetical protein
MNVPHNEQSSDVRNGGHVAELVELLQRGSFLLGTLCLAHDTYPANVKRFLDAVDEALKKHKA